MEFSLFALPTFYKETDGDPGSYFRRLIDMNGVRGAGPQLEREPGALRHRRVEFVDRRGLFAVSDDKDAGSVEPLALQP